MFDFSRFHLTTLQIHMLTLSQTYFMVIYHAVILGFRSCIFDCCYRCFGAKGFLLIQKDKHVYLLR
jgi:hypothetical protein